MTNSYLLLSMIILLSQTPRFTVSEGDQQVFNVSCSAEKCYDQNKSESLEMAAAKIQEHLDVMIDIVIPALQLSSKVSFTNLTSLTITGKAGQQTTINCKANAAILLSDISDTVTLINLKLLSCGASIRVKGSHNETKIYVSALSIVCCRNVEIYGLDISRSRGLGLTILDHHGDRMNITLTKIEHSELPQNYINTNINEVLTGGGGMYLELSYWPVQKAPIFVVFDNCTFDNNTADTKENNYLYTDAVGMLHEGAGRGGGMNLIVGPGVNNVNISFTGCIFFANQAFHGSGLAVKLLGEELQNVRVELIDCTFKRNGRNNYGFGAGFYLTIYDPSPDGDTVFNSIVILTNVEFVENHAEYGGAIFFFSSKQRFPNTNSLLFNKCTFTENVAHLGSAALISPSLYFRLSTGYSVIPKFKNCQFLGNKVRNSRHYDIQRTSGLGTIYVSEYKIQFMGYNCFKHNFGCGIYLVNGVIDFQNSSMLFNNNTGLKGGAVALIGSSTMIVGPNNYEFINNKAVYRGGAIYVSLFDRTDFTTSRRCFIQYVDNKMDVISHGWNLNLSFVGNRAKDRSAGHTIFATSFLPCQIIDSSLLEISEIFSNRSEHITLDDNATIEDQLATDGAKLNGIESKWLTMTPGIEHHHGVTLSDDFNNTVNVPFRATLVKKAGKALLDPVKSEFVGSEVKLIGYPSSEATLTLYTVSRRDTYIELTVTLTDCPPGFKLNGESKCVCNAATYVGLTGCSGNHSYLLPGYWAGIFNTTSGQKLVTSACPFRPEFYRADMFDFEVALPETFSESEMTVLVCGETRTGIGCGRCQENRTAYFHSPNFECGPSNSCKLGWIFYILSEMIPVTLIFISVLVLNISFTSGTVNGFILFSQLLLSFDTDASGIIQFPEHVKSKIEGATQIYKFLYGFLNLYMFNAQYFSFCLWRGASTLDMFALKYVTIIYAILLITAVILIMNKCGGKCLGKYCRITVIRVSVIRGITTYLILCYTQCIRVSISILIPLHIHVSTDDRNITCSSCTRVWYNGDLSYFHKEHLPYALPALFCLLTVGLIPPVLLLTYPLLNKVLSVLGLEDQKLVMVLSRKLQINYLKPLLDSFQGCFKDNFRFFAGLYFLYRWTFHLVLFVKSYGEYYTTIGGILLFIFTMHTVCQPYIKRSHNIIDALLFADLMLINFLSLFNFHKVYSHKAQFGTTVTPAIVQLVLIYLPLLIMATYLLVTSCKWSVRKGRKSLIARNVSNIRIPKKAFKLRELVLGVNPLGESIEMSEVDLPYERVEDQWKA